MDEVEDCAVVDDIFVRMLSSLECLGRRGRIKNGKI